MSVAQVIRIFGLALALAPLWLTSCLDGVARADDRSWRCGDVLVVPGMSQNEVERKCGQAQSRTTSFRETVQRPLEGGLVKTLVPVETWTYNRSSGELVRFLTFVDGRLDRIEVGGYGTD